MTGRWLLPAGDTGKPTWTVHTTGTPLAEICLGSGFAPVVDFTDPADIDALIWALAKARDALADAQANAGETSLPGLGAQGEPATGSGQPTLNTGQGHTDGPLELIPATREDGSYSPAFLAALRGEEPGAVIDPDCQAGKHGSCVGGPCECLCHAPPLPRRIPAGPPGADQEQADATSILLKWGAKPDEVAALAAPPEQEDESRD